jgi:outer membrane receptor protein involved in Fe transport
MRRVLIFTALLVLLGGEAFAQPLCQLDEMARAYAAGNFDQARQAIDACLTGRPTSDERVQAYALRAKLSLAIDDVDAAQQAVAALLGAMPDFAPSFDDPPRFVRMVTQLKRELARNTTSSVSKMNESLLEAPATVTVVTAEQIRRRGYLDLEAVLHDLPGFDISRSNGYSYSNIYQRGYRSDTTNRTLFLVDGVEQNDLHSNTAHISRQFPLTNIDRLEVVYGPASTMYGANAFLGVINVITRDPDDVIAEGKHVGADVQAGGGAWHSRFLDATIAGRLRGATLSLTGRVYKSNEWDLSRDANWNYAADAFGSQAAKDQYDRYLFGSGFGQFVRDIVGETRFEGRFNPVTLDPKAFEAPFNGHRVAYSELTDDWMMSGKLKLKNFTVGVQAWQRREGATGEGTDFEVPGALNGNIWIPHETSFFVRYAEPLTGNLSFSYFGQAKVHSVEPGSSVFSMNSYLNGPLDVFDLFANFDLSKDDGVPAYWTQALVAQSSNQIRNELNLVYRRANTLSVVSGVDVRNGSIQADYVKGTNCIPIPPLFSNFKADELRDAVTRFATNFFVTNRIIQLLAFNQPTGGVWVQCVQTGAPASLPDAGGEHFTVRDIGAFAQASYKPSRTVKLVAGWRVDNDHINQGSGFGTVFTPRLGMVYSPGGFVTKAIYSEAFKDPSNLEKFTTIPGVLDRPDRPLQPERARSLEVSAGRRWDRFSADVAAYQTTYSNLVTLAPHALAFDPQVKQFLDGLADRLRGEALSVFTFQTAIARALPSAVANEPADVLRKIFDNPLFTHRFENAGALRVRGVQANASFQYRNIDLFGNYTYTNPKFTESTNELHLISRSPSLRVGDIASHHVNVGAQHRWRKLDTSVRLNYVGARPTVLSNPESEIPSYAVANAAVSYDFLPGVTAQLVVNNIFSTKYSDPGVRTADDIRFAAHIPQPGRSIFLKLLTRVF